MQKALRAHNVRMLLMLADSLFTFTPILLASGTSIASLTEDLALSPSVSPLGMADRISIHGTHFICSQTGRTLQLRGVSLSGSSKLPTGLPSHSNDTAAFFDHANVSYIGRPFPLEEMDEHLSRIRDWGFRVVRLVVTWEALEHAGWSADTSCDRLRATLTSAST